jgi:hypothetical protein
MMASKNENWVEFHTLAHRSGICFSLLSSLFGQAGTSRPQRKPDGIKENFWPDLNDGFEPFSGLLFLELIINFGPLQSLALKTA